MTTAGKAARPSWWDQKYDSAWNRVKDAFHRDWEQTKHDLGGNEPNLHQGVADTIGQAIGSRPIPPGDVPNYEQQEPAFRFGYGAQLHFTDEKFPEWNAELERQLEEDWPEDWPTSREAVRRGWEYSRLGNRATPPL